MAKIKIEFTRNTTPQESGEATYKKGDKLDCEQTSADRWIRRKAAVIATAKTTKPKDKDR